MVWCGINHLRVSLPPLPLTRTLAEKPTGLPTRTLAGSERFRRNPLDSDSTGSRTKTRSLARPAGLGTARGERRESRRFPSTGGRDQLAERASWRAPAGLEPAPPGLEGRCS